MTCTPGDVARPAVGLALVVLLASTGAGAAPTFTVNSLVDVPGGGDLADGVCETATGNGVCTLRAAVMEANHVPGGGATIVLPAGIYPLTRPPLDPDGETAGDLDLLAPMTIVGEGPAVTIVDGNAFDRIFDVDEVEVVLRSFAVGDGDTLGTGGCVRNLGTLTLDHFAIVPVPGDASGRSCRSIRGGGVDDNGGTLTIRHAVIAAATTLEGSGPGGGVCNVGGSTLRIEDSLLSGNLAGNGGALFNVGDASITRTSLLDNFAFAGGALYNVGQAVVWNSTLSGNQGAEVGGAVRAANGTLELVHVTIGGNHALETSASGGGISVSSPGQVTLRNPIVAGGHRASCTLSGSLANVNASNAPGVLQPLAMNGGFAPDQQSSWGATIPLASCVDPLGAPLREDGRGYLRGVSGACEPGAVEWSGGYAPDPLLGVELLRNGGAQGNEYGLAVTDLTLALAPYWGVETGSLGQVVYGSPLGFPTAAEAPAGSGVHFLSGGFQSPSSLFQQIDLGSAADAIDAGTLRYRVAGAFGGYADEDDSATLTITFVDAGNDNLEVQSIGGFSAADRGNQTKLLPDSHVGVVPPGTRRIHVSLLAESADFDFNDGYADRLSLVVPEPFGRASALAAATALALLARRRSRVRARD